MENRDDGEFIRRNDFDILKIKTKNVVLIWQNVHGITSEEVACKLDNAMLKWQVELTETLGIWIDKGLAMTEGELILARANLGAVVEVWLKFFYCVYYEDYCKGPITDKRGNLVEPEDMSFERLKEFSTGKLWEDRKSFEYGWVDRYSIKEMRFILLIIERLGRRRSFWMMLII